MRRLWLLGTLVVGGCFIFDDPTQDDPPGSGGPSVDDDSIPATPYCMDAVTWHADNIELEEEVLVLVNEARAAGANCGGVSFAPAGELTMNGALRCAARVHSADMATRGFFDHVNPDGDDPFVRMEAAGLRYTLAGENIAAGQRTPEEVMQGWMASPGHCMNIMEPGFTHMGVGVYYGGSESLGIFWTQTFGAPL